MVKKLRQRSLMIGLWWLLAATAVGIIGVKMEQAGEKPLPGEPARSQLESIYDSAQRIVDGNPLGSRSYYHRGEAVGVDGRLSVQSRESSFKKLTDGFVAERWLIRDSKQRDGQVVYVKLCKDGIATVIDGRESTSDDSFYMGVIWTKNPNHVAWCEK